MNTLHNRPDATATRDMWQSQYDTLLQSVLRTIPPPHSFEGKGWFSAWQPQFNGACKTPQSKLLLKFTPQTLCPKVKAFYQNKENAGRRRPIGITPIKRPLQPRSLDAAISSTPAKQARTFAGGGSALASVLGGRANQPLALPDAFDLDGEDSDSALEDVLKIAPVDEVTVEVEASAPYTHMIGTYMAKDVKYVLLVIKAIPPTDGANLSTTIINGDTIEVQTVLPHMGVIEANKISQFFADKGELSDVQALHMQRFILKMCDKQSPTWRYSVKLPFKLDGSRLITIRTYFPVAGTDRADHVLVIHVPEYLEQVTQHNKSIELI